MEQQFFPKEIRGRFILRNPKGERPSLIYFLVRINGKQLKLTTHVKCYPQHWNPKKQEAYISTLLSEIDNRNNAITNNKLSQIKLSFERFLQYIFDNPTKMSDATMLIKNFIYNKKEKKMKKGQALNIFKYLKESILKDTVDSGSKETYQRVINRFQEFVNSTNQSINTFNDITKSVITDYQSYLCNLTNQPKCKDGRLSTNYIKGLIKVLLQRLEIYAVRNDMMDKNVLENAKTYKRLKSKVKCSENSIALRDDEVYRLYHHQTNNQRDEDVKNLFCLNCVTGQRISDTSKICDNINNICNITTIQLKQKKCGSPIDVPILFQMALDILNKYPDGLPKISDTIMNRRIKIIAKNAGIATDTKVISRQSGTSTNACTTSVHRYELITTHTGRRTFITMLSLRGYPARYIKDYSGHEDMRMVELYSKTTPSERGYFEATKRDNPHMILEMIDEKRGKEKDLKKENEFTSNEVPVNLFEEYTNKVTENVLLKQEQEKYKEELKAQIKQLANLNLQLRSAKNYEEVFSIDEYLDRVAELALQEEM